MKGSSGLPLATSNNLTVAVERNVPIQYLPLNLELELVMISRYIFPEYVVFRYLSPPP